MRWCRRITVRATSPEAAGTLALRTRWTPSTIGLSTGGRVYGSAEPMAHSPSTVTLGPRDRAGIDAPGAIPRRWSLVARADRWAIALFVAVPVLMGVPPALVGRPLFPGSGTADNLTQNYPLGCCRESCCGTVGCRCGTRTSGAGRPCSRDGTRDPCTRARGSSPSCPPARRGRSTSPAVSVICGVGMHVFLRRLGCSPLAALLGALDVHLHRVHERPSRAPRPGHGHELHSLDAARRPRARNLPRAASGPALDLRCWAAAVGL